MYLPTPETPSEGVFLGAAYTRGCGDVLAGSSFGRCSPDLAPPPAKRQQTTNTHADAGAGDRAIPADKRPAGGGQVAGSWPPPPPTTTTGDGDHDRDGERGGDAVEPRPAPASSPTKATQTDFPDPSALAESLPMLIELRDEVDGDDVQHDADHDDDDAVNDDDEGRDPHQTDTFVRLLPYTIRLNAQFLPRVTIRRIGLKSAIGALCIGNRLLPYNLTSFALRFYRATPC